MGIEPGEDAPPDLPPYLAASPYGIETMEAALDIADRAGKAVLQVVGNAEEEGLADIVTTAQAAVAQKPNHPGIRPAKGRRGRPRGTARNSPAASSTHSTDIAGEPASEVALQPMDDGRDETPVGSESGGAEPRRSGRKITKSYKVR